MLSIDVTIEAKIIILEEKKQSLQSKLYKVFTIVGVGPHMMFYGVESNREGN